MHRLNVTRVFDQLGGPAIVHQRLDQAYPEEGLKYATVQMWKQRGEISQRWQVPVMMQLRDSKVDPFDFIDDDNPF